MVVSSLNSVSGTVLARSQNVTLLIRLWTNEICDFAVN